MNRHYNSSKKLSSVFTHKDKGISCNRDFSNPNNSIENYSEDNILDEITKKYSISIDSYHRDYNTYPNPIEFTVIFGPNAKSYYKGTEYPGSPPPYIHKTFENIKYINCDRMLLPKYFPKIVKISPTSYTGTENIYKYKFESPITDAYTNLSGYRYLIFDSENIKGDFDCSTGDKVRNSFGTIFPDDIPDDRDHYTVYHKNCHKQFDENNLGSIQKISIKFLTDKGKSIPSPIFKDENGDILKFNSGGEVKNPPVGYADLIVNNNSQRSGLDCRIPQSYKHEDTVPCFCEDCYDYHPKHSKYQMYTQFEFGIKEIQNIKCTRNLNLVSKKFK
jgi:hypothetical protein